MPQTDAESTNGAYGFKFDEEPAAIVHLLRASDPVDFKKMCPDLEQHGRSTGAGAMFSSMFRALHGAKKKLVSCRIGRRPRTSVPRTNSARKSAAHDGRWQRGIRVIRLPRLRKRSEELSM
jgi:hypothetical protein